METHREPCPRLPSERWDVHFEADQQVMDRAALDARLVAQVVRRLAESWRDLNYCYLGSRLKPPSIALHEGQARWGSWDPGRRLITVSRRQVLCYTWESVVETLKHEMAHQFVSEILGEPDEAPHGMAFGQACRHLAVDPSPRGDGGIPLFRAHEALRADPDDARLARIQKLLALADRNPDEHEARAAFARASELMLKYNLDARSPQEGDYVHRFLGASSGRVPHHHYLVAGILQEFFFVQCIWVDSYDVRRDVRGHRLEIMGKRANVDVAEYVYECLHRQADVLWRGFKKDNGIRDRRAKRQYLDGLLAGFRGQLEQTSAKSEERGLIWLGDPNLERFAASRHPRTTHSRLSGVSGSQVRDEGVRAGARLRLHQPLRGPTRSRGRHLPGPGRG